MTAALRLYYAYGALVLCCLLGAMVTGQWWVVGLPALPLAAYAVVTDFSRLFWLLMALLPLGTEVYLPGGFGTDLPTEPVAVALLGIFLLHAAGNWTTYRARYFAHPIALVLYLHLIWLVVATTGSSTPFISLKFVLSKLWYVAAFFWVPLLLLRSPGRLDTFAYCIFWPLLFVAVQAFLRHAAYGFTFADQFRTMYPFMRNHVNYAGMLAVFAPWVMYLVYRRRGRGQSTGWLWFLVVPFWLVAIYFSYTRAAYVTLVLAAVAFFLVRRRWLRPAIVLGVAAGIGVAAYLVRDNRYLDYAPNYDTTIAHTQFDNLIEATYKLEDISTMERFYRWVAGGNMVPYRPLTGWGPGSFVEQYKGYTTDNFQTYVSDNPERSGVHNYYLMTLVEQGYVGLGIILLLMIGTVWIGEGIYHRQPDPGARAAIMAAMLSLIVIDAFCLINDMLETDKVGSLFFLSLAILVTMNNYRGEATDTTR